MNTPVFERRRFVAAALVAAAAVGSRARAQPLPWPSQPIRLVTGGAGGVTDIRARWLAERLGAALGQPVIVENQPAAGGNVAAAQVARALPDGHTLMFTHQGQAAVNPHVYSNPGYDSLRDFAPVARFGIGALVLVVPSSSALTSAGDLMARAKARPRAMNFGSPGNGLPPHLAAVLFMRLGGFEATHIPYKGGGAMMTALLAGEVDWVIEGLTAALPQTKAGRLRALGVTGTRRSPSLPDVPTLAEAGVPGYEYIGWTGVVAPAATPGAIVERLNAEINRIATGDEGRRWFQGTGADSGEQTPAEFGTFLRAEHAKFGELVRSAGLRAE
jgi:tripartite-type tricarboxylate transporter receptor subunit TctC